MASSIIASNILFVSPYAFKDLSFSTLPSLLLVVDPRRTITRTGRMVASLNLVVATEKDSFGFCNFRRSNRRSCGGFFRKCKGWEREEDCALETEILEFMDKSKNPEAFPTKKELIDAGRMDLVEAILKQRGWLSYGWDLDDEEQESVSEGGGFVNWDSIMDQECDNGVLEQRILESNEVRGSGVNSFDCNSSQSASSSGRSFETEAEDTTGIEGILSRLEKQRNMTFGIDLTERGNSTHVSSNDDVYGWHPGSSTDMTVAGHERSRRPASVSLNKGIQNDSCSKLTPSNFDGARNSLDPEMWRTGSIQRAGFSDTEFEDAEIAFNESGKGGAMDTLKDEMISIKGDASGPLERRKELNSCVQEIDSNPLRTRLQHLELELASTLRLLRSKTDEFITQKGHESSSDDLLNLSDAWEFQENEIMNAQNRLRSIRAKLAVLEGKMALNIIDAQKIVEEKQKRIDDARITLQLLRTACIVWPNSASKVLLTGSFDGWATQRKMEKSNTGIFSLCLKLYPGRYEIKFIVDGIWRIDPLRPIVHSNGYENNLLIIT